MEHSRLLSLPKELRLEIWTYVLTDPSVVDLTLHIRRRNTGLSTSVKTHFDRPRRAPINLNLLRTNQLLYDEGIPILYRSVRFYPCDLEGIFPLFLDTVSPFAISYIRFVKLSLLRQSGEHFYFHWALTCAQVAKLSTSLRRVDVEGYWLPAGNSKNMSRILNPLVKIKAPKRFDLECDDGLQQLLKKYGEELAAKPVIERALTAIETNEDPRRGYGKRIGIGELLQKRPKLQDFTLQGKPTSGLLPMFAEEKETANDLRAVAGIKKFESDLQESGTAPEDHDSVNLKKRTASTASILDDESWTDTTSTIAARDGDLDVSKDSDDWEFVSKPSSPI